MKKAIAIIPHVFYSILLVWAVYLFIDLPRGDYGLIVPSLIFVFAPLPSAISAVGLMIVNIKTKAENKGISIAYGVIGSFLLILYAVLFLGVANINFDGIFYWAYLTAVIVAPFCLFAIWVLWIIGAVKSRKCKGGFKYVPKN